MRQQDLVQLPLEEIAVREEVLRVRGRQFGHDQHSRFVGRFEVLRRRSHRMKTHGVEAEALRKFEPLQVRSARSGRKSGEHLYVIVSVAAQVDRLAVEQQHAAARRELA